MRCLKGVRESSGALDTPATRTDRYANLTPLTAVEKPPPPPVARRPEPRWLAARALEPELMDLCTPEREAEIVDMSPLGATMDAALGADVFSYVPAPQPPALLPAAACGALRLGEQLELA